MKCLKEGCSGTAVNGNYCVLHTKKFGKPRPGVVGLTARGINRGDSVSEIVGYAIRAELKLGPRVPVKVWVADRSEKQYKKNKSINTRIFKVRKNELNEALKELESEGVKRYLWNGRSR